MNLNDNLIERLKLVFDRWEKFIAHRTSEQSVASLSRQAPATEQDRCSLLKKDTDLEVEKREWSLGESRVIDARRRMRGGMIKANTSPRTGLVVVDFRNAS